MKPSREHERIKCFIRSLVTFWCIDRDIELSGFGSWTVQDKKVMCGAEADDCYIFGRQPRDSPTANSFGRSAAGFFPLSTSRSSRRCSTALLSIRPSATSEP
jgi:hypothetical protein